jgi:hypothetical protein
MTGERKLGRRRRFARLLAEYERNLRNRVQRGDIKEVTLDTYLNDANRVFEALVFATERTDIAKAMRSYAYRGYYRGVIGDLKQIVEERAALSEILRKG